MVVGIRRRGIAEWGGGDDRWTRVVGSGSSLGFVRRMGRLGVGVVVIGDGPIVGGSWLCLFVVRWWVLLVVQRLAVVRGDHANILELWWLGGLLLSAALVQLVIDEWGGRVRRRVVC